MTSHCPTRDRLLDSIWTAGSRLSSTTRFLFKNEGKRSDDSLRAMCDCTEQRAIVSDLRSRLKEHYGAHHCEL